MRAICPWVAVLLIFNVTACYRWEPLPTLSPPAVLEQQNELRLSLRGEANTVTLTNMLLVGGDSLRGSTTEAPRVRTVALGDIESIEARRVDPWSTFAALVMVPAAVLLGVAAAGCSGDGLVC